MNGAVFALAAHEGSIYASGYFTLAGDVPANGMARYDGEQWHSVPEFWQAIGFEVHEGDLYACGEYGPRVGRLEGDAWKPIGQVPGKVYDLASYGGDLYAAGGEFTGASGDPIYGLARWDGKAWNPVGGGIYGPVYALEFHEGELIAGGQFCQAEGQWVSSTAAYNGQAWRPLGYGLQHETLDGMCCPPGQVLRLIAHEELVFASGEFRLSGPHWEGCQAYPAGPVFIANLAAWDGLAWSHVSEDEAGGNIWVFASYVNDLIIGGRLFFGALRPHILRWDGIQWNTMGEGPDDEVYALAVLDNELYVGGSFTSAGGQEARYIARWVEEPELVEVSTFTAARSGDSATIHWAVSRASNHLGFYLYRRPASPGAPPPGVDEQDLERVTDRFFEGGNEYTFIDEAVSSEPSEYWLKEIDRSGLQSWFGPALLMEADGTPPVTVPGDMVRIHPNPFAPSQGAPAIHAMLARPSRMTVAIFDASSRWVRTLHSGPGMSGMNRFEWNGRDESGRDLAAGVYFVRLTTNGAVQTSKMVLIR